MDADCLDGCGCGVAAWSRVWTARKQHVCMHACAEPAGGVRPGRSGARARTGVDADVVKGQGEVRDIGGHGLGAQHLARDEVAGKEQLGGRGDNGGRGRADDSWRFSTPQPKATCWTAAEMLPHTRRCPS
jgi:hypothetical protein